MRFYFQKSISHFRDINGKKETHFEIVKGNEHHVKKLKGFSSSPNSDNFNIEEHIMKKNNKRGSLSNKYRIFKIKSSNLNTLLKESKNIKKMHMENNEKNNGKIQPIKIKKISKKDRKVEKMKDEKKVVKKDEKKVVKKDEKKKVVKKDEKKKVVKKDEKKKVVKKDEKKVVKKDEKKKVVKKDEKKVIKKDEKKMVKDEKKVTKKDEKKNVVKKVEKKKDNVDKNIKRKKSLDVLNK
jgi:histone H1/5